MLSWTFLWNYCFPCLKEDYACSCLVATVVPQWTIGLRLLCPWDSSGKSTGVGCHALLQEIFPTKGSNPSLLHCRQILLLLNYRGSLIENYRMFLMTVIVINQGKVYFLNFKKWLSIDNHSFHLIRASASDTLWTWLSLTHLNLVMILWNSPIVILTDRWGNQSPERLGDLPKITHVVVGIMKTCCRSFLLQNPCHNTCRL